MYIIIHKKKKKQALYGIFNKRSVINLLFIKKEKI